jgi:hypothetical protein
VNQTQEELQKGKEVAEAYARLEAEEVAYDEVEVESEGESGFEYGFREFMEPVARPAKGRLEGEPLQEFLRLSDTKCRLPLSYGDGSRGDGLQAISLMDSPDAEEPIDLDEQLKRLLAGRRVSFQQVNAFLRYHVPRVAHYAADEIVEWANADGQTSKRILRAINGLREAETILVGPIGLLMNDYLQARSIINGEKSPNFLAGNDLNRHNIGELLSYLANESFDFERERALKALDLLASYDAAYLGEGMRALMSGEPAPHWLRRNVDDVTLIAALPYDAQQRLGRYMEDLETLTRAKSSGLVAKVFHSRGQLSELLRNWIADVAWRRAELVRLALIAHRLEHDKYPESLEALVGDFLREEEIRDPYTGEPFGWALEGFEYSVHIPDELEDSPPPRGTPMLWSGGSGLAVPTEREVKVDHREDKSEPDNLTIEEGTPVRMMSLQPSEELIFWPTGAFWMPLPK